MKLNYFLAALLVVGASSGLTSCINTDEPEGFLLLRTSKSELIKAQTAIENAKAAQELARAKYMQIQNEMEQILLDYKKLEFDQKGTLLKTEIAVSILECEAKLANAQIAKLKADEALTDALREIELAKLSLSDGEKEAITKAESFLAQKQTALNTAHSNLLGAQGELNNLMTNKDHYSLKANYKFNLAVAENDLKLKNDLIAELTELKDIPAQVAEWEKKLEEQKQVVALKLTASNKAKLLLETAVNADEYVALKKAAQIAGEKLMEIADAAPEMEEAYSYDFNADGKGALESHYEELGLNVNKSYTSFEEDVYTFKKDAKMADVLADLKDVKEAAEDILKTKYLTNHIANFNAEVANAKTAVSSAKKAYEKASTKWAEALKTYNDAVADDTATPSQKNDLISASQAAFGTLLSGPDGYVLVQPNFNEIKGADYDVASLGALGGYIGAYKAQEKAELKLLKKPALEALVSQVSSRISSYAKVVDAYNKSLEDAADAKDAADEKQSAYDAEKLNPLKLEDSYASLEHSNAVALESTIKSILSAYASDIRDLDSEKYTKEIDAEIFDAKASLYNLEAEVEYAQAMLKSFEEGKYDVNSQIELVSKRVETFKSSYDYAFDAYSRALESLNVLIAEITKE